ncbi:MAG: YciI family protein [Caulobacterales bacterium]|nr:YciI family protein [Caulobacterales bacterium]
MLYAILAYHDESEIQALSEDEDIALMAGLRRAHERVNEEGRLGPAARLGATATAAVVRGRRKGLVTDGPFAETKEALLGFYVVDCPDRAAAIAAAQHLKDANPTAAYEIREIALYLPGVPFPVTDAGLEPVRPARV